jgi:ATP-dependent Lhr-like helicase
MKADIVPPEKMTRIIVESARARLLNETRVLACLRCRNFVDSIRLRDLQEKLTCPECSSTELGVFDQPINEIMKVLARKSGSVPKQVEWWWGRGKDASKLVSIYGRRGVIVAAAKRVDFTEAWDILAQTEGESDYFFERIVEAERKALSRRFI